MSSFSRAFDQKVSAILAIVTLAASTSFAATTSTGDISPANIATWTKNTTGTIGNTGIGAVTVNNGSTLLSNTATLGQASGSNGSVSIDGAGSTWATVNLSVGASGNGSLEITNAGTVNNAFANVANSAGSVGTVLIDGAGSLWTNADANLGYGGDGTLTIRNAGNANCSNINVGYNVGSSGTLLVDGVGSLFNGAFPTIGYGGSGTLTISNGGSATNADSTLGYNAGSVGNASVTGVASLWTTSSLTVGDSGIGHLSIANGATVTATDSDLGLQPGSTGTVSVDGPNSAWKASDLTVGFSGNASLAITGGGNVQSIFVSIGYNAGSIAMVTVDGPGSTWSSSSTLTVGFSGKGTLSVTNGGNVTNGPASYIGENAGSIGTVTIDGPASTWSTGYLAIGFSGNATLTITNGAHVNVSSVLSQSSIGSGTGSNGIATIDGPSSAWTTSYQFYVGQSGNGTLNITDGATVTVGQALYVAYAVSSTGLINFGSVGGTLATQSLYASPTQFTGNGTINTNGLVTDMSIQFDATHGLKQSLTWNDAGQNVSVNLDMSGISMAPGDLGAGYQGVGSLTIQEGIAVTAANVYLGFKTGSVGTGIISGNGSACSATNLYVGNSGNASLSILNDGSMTVSATAAVGENTGSVGTVVVDGIGSALHGNVLSIGNSGTGTLVISWGAVVSANQTYVSGTVGFGSNGGVLTTQTLYFSSPSQFTGTGTINTAGLVADGVLVFDSSHGLTQNFSWNSPTQNVTLALDLTGQSGPIGDLGAGFLGTGVLTIDAGASVTSANGTFGVNAAAVGTGIVSGAGSMWTNTSIYLGKSGKGILNVTNGGTINTSADSFIGYGTGSGVATVQGAGSTWSGRNFYVDYTGPGTLNVLDGGSVRGTGQVVIGDIFGSGGTVNVDDSGSILTIPQITIGQNTTGTLTIRNGGTVNSTQSTIGAKGTVIVDGNGSSWAASALTVGSFFGNGTLVISTGGSVTAQSVSISPGSLLSIDAGDGSTLDDHTGSFSDSGTLRLKAVPGALAGSYAPILAASWSGLSSVQALGGSWNNTTHTFIVAAAATGASGQPVFLNLAQTQRALITDASSAHMLQLGFQAATTNSNITLTAAPINASQNLSLQSALNANESILAGWTVTTTGSGYATGSPVFVSVGVGANYTTSALAIWQFNGSTWTPYAPADLAYDGTYTNFTATALGGYAIVTTYDLLGDANLDGKVDLTDLNIVLNNLGTTTSLRSAGNFDGQPTIDLTDLNDVLNNLGTTYATNNAGLAISTPEPSSLGIIAMVTPLLFHRRRRQYQNINCPHP